MDTLSQWAHKWGVSDQALHDLQRVLGAASMPLDSDTVLHDEAVVQSRVRLAAAKQGVILWRNNVGACMDERGTFLRYGLANDSKRVNERIKSSDLIGIKKLPVTQDMVGQHVGQFVALEVKRGGWVFKGSDREQAQLNFLTLVSGMGGDAKFINDAGDL